MTRQTVRFDSWLVGLALLASAMGLVMIFDAGFVRSISSGDGPIPREFRNQCIFLLISIAACAIGTKIKLSTWQKLAPWLFAVGLVGLFAVKCAGVELNGAQRWVGVRGFLLQPSEFMKLAALLFLGSVLVDRQPAKYPRTSKNWADFMDRFVVPWLKRIFPGLLVLVALYLIEREPDLGTAAVLGAISVAMFVLGGVSKKTLAVLAVLGLVGGMVMVKAEPYRLERITSHFDRWNSANVDDIGYQTTQSEAAMALGSVSGVGPGAGRAKHFMPAATTDFIMATIAEEYGLLGSLAVLGVLGAIVFRLIFLMQQAATSFGRLILGATAVWIGVQSCVNMMMANGALPAIGIPLPFFSSGGSSLVALWFGIGICQSALLVRREKEAEKLEAHRDGWRDRRARLSRA